MKKIKILLLCITSLIFFCTQRAMQVKIEDTEKSIILNVKGLTKKESREVEKWMNSVKFDITRKGEDFIGYFGDVIKNGNLLIFKFLVACCKAKDYAYHLSYSKKLGCCKDETILERVICCEQLEMVRHLINNRVDVNDGESLHQAIRLSSKPIVEILVKSSAYIDEQGLYEQTPLEREGSSNFIKLLLEFGTTKYGNDNAKNKTYKKFLKLSEYWYQRGNEFGCGKTMFDLAKYVAIYSRNSIQKDFYKFNNNYDLKFIYNMKFIL